MCPDPLMVINQSLHTSCDHEVFLLSSMYLFTSSCTVYADKFAKFIAFEKICMIIFVIVHQCEKLFH